MADLLGAPAGDSFQAATVDIDDESFDSVMSSLQPRVRFRVANKLLGVGFLDVDMTFATMADFSPVTVARNSKHLNTLLQVRAKLSKCLGSNDGGKLEHEVAEQIKSPELEALSRIIEHSQSDWGSAIQRLLDPQHGSSVSSPNGSIGQRVAAVIAIIDDVLSEQINLILHHEDFRRLEGAWRGLDRLVHGIETSPIAKIWLMNISKTELGHALKRSPGDAWDWNPILQRLQDDGCCSPDEGPYGVLIGDYCFDHSREDIEMLARLAKVASAIHAPFIAGAAPSIAGLGSWQELRSPRDLTATFRRSEYGAWHALRQVDESRYLGLTLPRCLARLPYGPEGLPVTEFKFEEDIEGTDETRFVWFNAAYAIGMNISRAQQCYGWPALISGHERGGDIYGLPTHTFPVEDGSIHQYCPTEIAVTEELERTLTANGFLPICHVKYKDYAVLVNCPSVHKPADHEIPYLADEARLTSRFSYLLGACRFAHFLKYIVRNATDAPANATDLEGWLNRWLESQCCSPNASQEVKTLHPLAEGKVEILEWDKATRKGTTMLRVRPHFQLDAAPLFEIRVELEGCPPTSNGGT